MEKAKRKHKALFITLGALVGFLALSAASFFIYAAVYYHADEVSAYLTSSSTVTVKEEGNISFTPTTAEKAGFVFYPGAKVEEKAYAPLCFHLAEHGVYSLIIKMPFRLAIFGQDKGKDLPARNPDIPWYLGGHSLGGALAGSFLSQDNHGYAGAAFLAAYSTADLSKSGLRTATIYGSNDQVLNKDKYQSCLKNLPATNVETIIPGGNHSGYAYYGPQKGDGTATITKDEQIAQTVQAVLTLMGL